MKNQAKDGDLRGAPAALTVAEATPGAYRIVRVSLSDSERIGGRLRDLGFVPGERIEILGRGPWRGAIIVECRGAAFALRPSEAQRIEVAL